MNEIDFDNWEDYKPIIKENNEINVINNPNLAILSINENFKNLSDISYEELEHFLSDSFEDKFIKFLKKDSIRDIDIFNSSKYNDLFLLIKDNIKYLVYVYECNGYHFDDNQIVFTGWDNNAIINIDTMSYKEIDIR